MFNILRDCDNIILYFEIFGLDDQVDPPFLCITQHPSFQTVCLQREVLETAIVGLSQVRGMRVPQEMNKM